MKAKSKEVISIGTRVGAVLGGFTFLAVGVVPGFHYGGYGALMLFSKLAGGPVEFTPGIRLVIALGILLGILCLGFMSIVLGSVLGTISGYVVNGLGALGEHAKKGEIVLNGEAVRAERVPLHKEG
jgi:hypothetical protein